jgi:outer membrane protein assembly factor BamB
MPEVQAARPFQSGRIGGWRLRLPGGLPLATPAVAGGRVFLGGGFGSYEFYTFDAETGQLLWQHQTTDDGPTAAVVEDEFVVFNTESCELEVLTVEGRPVWKHWLGDPLMSMPAVDRGKVYMAYPDSRQDGQHYLACFDLKTGTRDWRSPIAGEIITAPVLADDRVYLTTLDGTLYCFDQFDGTLLWHEAKNATSAPLAVSGQCYFSRREEVPLAAAGRHGTQQTEHCAARGVEAESATVAFAATARVADYLDHTKRRRGSQLYGAYAAADAHVGFALHKGSAKMAQAMKNLGQAHVAGVWAFQGSKPFLAKGRLYSPMGDTLQCVDVDTSELVWSQNLGQPGAAGELLDSVLTPPAIVNDKVFVGTSYGTVHCFAADTGELLWSVPLGEPIVFQPAVAQGRVYVATQSGSLFCLETGDPCDDGWLMWGATPAHNGLPDYCFESIFAGDERTLQPA